MAKRTYVGRRRSRAGKRRRRRGGLRAALAFLSLIIAGIAIVLALSVFFKIRHIEVTGSTRYSENEVQQAAGISVGDNLFRINKFNAIDNIFKKMPYVDELRIRRALPDTLIINITDSIPVAYVESGEYCWLIDKNGKVLERVDKEKAKDYAKIGGLTILSPAEGDSMYVPEAERPLQNSLFEVIRALNDADIIKDVSEISINGSYEIGFLYSDRLRVRIQMPCDLNNKTRFLLAVMEKLDPNDKGELDMTSDKTTRFIPDSDTSASPNVDTDGGESAS